MSNDRILLAILPPTPHFSRAEKTLGEFAGERGFTFKRLDTATGSFGAEAACDSIASADLVVLDMTGRNPQVLFCLGVACGLKKAIQLIACNPEDAVIPGLPEPVIYSGIPEALKAGLAVALSTQPAPGAETTDAPREAFERLFGDILKEHGHVHRGEVLRENESTFVLVNQDMDLPLVQELARKARSLNMRIKLM